jgi:hypothetical protein
MNLRQYYEAFLLRLWSQPPIVHFTGAIVMLTACLVIPWIAKLLTLAGSPVFLAMAVFYTSLGLLKLLSLLAKRFGWFNEYL